MTTITSHRPTTSRASYTQANRDEAWAGLGLFERISLVLILLMVLIMYGSLLLAHYQLRGQQPAAPQNIVELYKQASQQQLAP